MRCYLYTDAPLYTKVSLTNFAAAPTLAVAAAAAELLMTDVLPLTPSAMPHSVSHPGLPTDTIEACQSTASRFIQTLGDRRYGERAVNPGVKLESS